MSDSVTSKTSRWNLALALAVAVGAALLVIAAPWLLLGKKDALTIGVEGRYSLVLPERGLAAVPYTHGDALAVRIAQATPVDGGVRYDIRYMAYGPGPHDLARFLVAAPGAAPLDLPELPVQVEPLLPADYSGVLFDSTPSPVNLHSRYRYYMTALWLAWAGLLVPLLLIGWRRRRSVRPVPVPTTAERLHALLQQAEQEPLAPEQLADLEQLLLAWWAEQLDVHCDRLSDTLARIRQHPPAALQIAAVEQWLHDRSGAAGKNVPRELLRQLGWSHAAPKADSPESSSPESSPTQEALAR
ncbi:hypothetical protein [Lignipirellula cremea]|uniref:Uncharacterized protein n=1 Tax=Lignipirellula cremea TaxID=2528010 RepID=A0A518DLY8_9BACT|nr:hypothetical protein [Lignipirellula cremea]QDU92857.1 hypothetical protein Pla8534_06300 [Lignipirellula cremea]